MAEDQRIHGEADLIEGFLRPLAAGFSGAFGLGDDCASLAPPPGSDLVLTTDAVAAGVHFLPDDRPEDVAWKALAVNVSDLAGKGATPIVYLMALAFPEAPQRAWIERFATGLATAQARFAITLAGGDTDRRPGPLSINITAIGSVPHGRMVRRATARAGDMLFVSGTLGDAALGLELHKDPARAAAWHLDRRDADELVDRYLRPVPRLELAEVLRNHASAAMDISDGLAKDLGRLCAASGVRATVTGAQLPLSAPVAAIVAAEPARFESVVAGGDDYEILAAVAPERAEDFRRAAADSGVRVTEIGRLQSGSGVEISNREGVPLRLERPGWDHF